MNNLKELQHIARGFKLLYVEDNEALRKNAAKLLKKIFVHVDLAENGEVGLALFKKNHHSIVITDIKMPKMDGMTLIKHIKKIRPETKAIVMSAYDDKKLLIQGIEFGVFRFLQKPVNVSDLSQTLYNAILEINHENHTKIFYMHLKSVFDHQSSMVVMINDSKIILSNDMFSDFFTSQCQDDCRISFDEISKQFLEHDGFLFNTAQQDVLETIKLNSQKLYHIKLKNSAGNIRHFILKYQDIPEKENYGVLSFDDITELNLLKLFDAKQSANDDNLKDTQAMFNLLEVIQRNSAKIELHNYYNGLSITNNGVITEVENEILTIKTTYMQQKAIQMEQKLLLVSSALPHAIECREIHKINFEKQIVELKLLRFVKTSPVTRNTIRVVPSGKQTVSFFIGENRFHGDIEIEDISLDAVKLKLNALPAGLDRDSDIVLDIVLELDKKPLIINTKASMFRKSESRHSFSVVFIFKELKKSKLVKYITKRQMELIREIKGMQNG